MQWRLHKAKSYQIRWLTSDHTTALIAAAVPFEVNEDGTFIEAEQLGTVLTVLNAQVVATFPSAFKRMDEVVLMVRREDDARAFGQFTVTFDRDFKLKEEHELVLNIIQEMLLPLVRRDIIVHLSQGEAREPVSDGRFHIFVDSAAIKTEATKIPERIFGIPVKVERGHAAYRASGRGTAIMDWEESFAAAELVDNCLYLHFDVLGGTPSQTRRALLLRILQRTVEELSADDVLAEVLDCLELGDMSGLSDLSVWFDKPVQRFGKQILALVARVLVPVVRKPIVVHMGAGAQSPVHDDNFHLFISGSPETTTGVAPPEKVFDLPVVDRSNAWSLAAGSFPVTDGRTDFVSAQVVGMNNLYVSFNPFAGGLKNQLALLSRILKASVRELDIDALIGEVIESVRREIVSDTLSDEIGESMPFDGLSELSADEASRFKVIVEGFSERRLAVVSALVRHLLVPVVGSDVFVGHSWGENQKPLRDGLFHVFFQSSPLGDRIVQSPAALFGEALLKPETAFWPSGKGIAIADDQGFLVAELVGKNLYIHQEIIHYGTRGEATILARLILAARKELGARSRKGHGEEIAGAYESECLTQIQRYFGVEAGDPESIRQSEQALKDAIARTLHSEKELYRLETTDHFGPEYDELLSIDKVLDVRVTDGWICVDTDVLYCVDDRTGVTHEIGAFEIQIPTTGGRLRWINKTRTVYGSDRNMYAPHVQADGYACEGTTKDEWPQFIAQRQFAYVVMKGIQFIESVNTSDVWGKQIHKWPVAHTA